MINEFKKIFSFQGRTSARNYSWFQCICNGLRILYFAIYLVTVYVYRLDMATLEDAVDLFSRCVVMLGIYVLLDIVMHILSVGISVRRCHDRDKNGAFVIWRFVPVIGQLIFFFMMRKKGDAESNRFGEPPADSMIEAKYALRCNLVLGILTSLLLFWSVVELGIQIMLTYFFAMLMVYMNTVISIFTFGQYSI